MLSDGQAKEISKHILKNKGLLRKQRAQEKWSKNKLFAIPKPFYPKAPLQTIAKDDLLSDILTSTIAYLPYLIRKWCGKSVSQNFPGLKIFVAPFAITR